MCECLVFTHIWPLSGDAALDAKRFKRGDIVAIKPDGWAWSGMESLAAWNAAGHDPADWPRMFALIKIPGVAVAKVEAILAPDTTTVGAMVDGEWHEEERLNVRRLRFLDIDGAPNAIKNKIGSDFEVTVTPTKIRNYIKQKSDGAVYDPGFD